MTAPYNEKPSSYDASVTTAPAEKTSNGAEETLKRWIRLSDVYTPPALCTTTSHSWSNTFMDWTVGPSALPAADSDFPVQVRGTYDYAPTAVWLLGSGGGSARVQHHVVYHVSVTRETIAGTFVDDLGGGRIKGTITHGSVSGASQDGRGEGDRKVESGEDGRVRVSFIKQYTLPFWMKLTRWEYVGTFTAEGIEGEWHYPGNARGHEGYGGRFTMRLSQDEVGDVTAEKQALNPPHPLLQVKGTYTYAGGGKVHSVNHSLRLTTSSISGTFVDDVGSGDIEGTVCGGDVVFIKRYTSPLWQQWTRWEYEGKFVDMEERRGKGIEGVWRGVGEAKRSWRGNFVMALGVDAEKEKRRSGKVASEWEGAEG